MKSPQIIKLLSGLEHTHLIYDLKDAAFLRRFKSIKPECIQLTFLDDDSKAYFAATLTKAGKEYLNNLKRETYVLS